MKRKALFVGVNEYEDAQIRDLNYSLSDAHALKTFFELFGYETDILENPVKSDVFRAVKQMTDDLSAGDLFFFYFAGHGWTTTAGKHLLFCKDDMYKYLRYDYNVGIPFDFLKKVTEGDYNRAFVLDACRSDFLTGTRGGDTTTRDLRPIGELVRDAPARSSLAVLRSCSQYEHALEIESRKHGLFTLAMMDVLRASKESGAELLFGESLCDAVTQKMADIARAEGIVAEQTPEFAKSGIAQVLVSGHRQTKDEPDAMPEDVSPQPVPPPHPAPESPSDKVAVTVPRVIIDKYMYLLYRCELRDLNVKLNEMVSPDASNESCRVVDAAAFVAFMRGMPDFLKIAKSHCAEDCRLELENWFRNNPSQETVDTGKLKVMNAICGSITGGKEWRQLK